MILIRFFWTQDKGMFLDYDTKSGFLDSVVIPFK